MTFEEAKGLLKLSREACWSYPSSQGGDMVRQDTELSKWTDRLEIWLEVGNFWTQCWELRRRNCRGAGRSLFMETDYSCSINVNWKSLKSTIKRRLKSLRRSMIEKHWHLPISV